MEQGSTLQGIARLGLGGSHLASLSTRPGKAEIDALLDDAYAAGIRFFDTADVYGQGDSERRLARLAAKTDVMICTKAGLALGVSQSLIRLAKPFLRPLLLRLKRGSQAAASLRQSSQTTNFDPDHLRRQLRGSLKRLRRDRVDVFLLHNPTLDDLADGTLLALLAEVKSQGLAKRVGISCYDLSDARQILQTGGIDALQIPLNAQTLPEAEPVLSMAAEQSVLIIAREVLPASIRQSLGITDGLAPLVADPRISVILSGTTSRAHLAQNVQAFQHSLTKQT